MTGQRNPNLGEFRHECGNTAHIRRASRGNKKLYAFCENCGMLHYNLPGGQAYLKRVGRFYDEPEPKPEPKRKTETADDENGWTVIT
jgi:hypothetical protein